MGKLKRAVFIISVIEIIIFAFDYRMPQLNLSHMYDIPIIVAAYYLGNLGALVTSIVSMLLLDFSYSTMRGTHPGLNGLIATNLTIIIVGVIAGSLSKSRGIHRTLANTDELTGLANRRFLQKALNYEFSRAKHDDIPLTILMLDIDKFKNINDAYGHTIGDNILKGISRILKESVRKVDFVSRYGGEEFCIVLPGTDGDNAFDVAERIRKTVEKTPVGLDNNGRAIMATISGGLSTYPQNARTISMLIDVADESLYQAKKTGRNRICTPFKRLKEPVQSGESM